MSKGTTVGRPTHRGPRGDHVGLIGGGLGLAPGVWCSPRRCVRACGRRLALRCPGYPMLLLVDLDGVVYTGADPVAGVAAVLTARVRAGDEVVYITNSSTGYRTEYAARLLDLGAPVAADHVVSSARATALYLASRNPRPRRVLALGTDGFRRELEDVGLAVVMAGDAAERRRTEGLDAVEAAGFPDAVVVGLDRSLTYERIALAAEVIRGGVPFIAANQDSVFPGERCLWPGAGGLVAAVQDAAGIAPIAIGKPGRYLLDEAARVVGRSASEAVVIGDSLVSDLLAARAVGARFVLMLTGVTSRWEYEALAPDDRPDAVASNAEELAGVLRAGVTERVMTLGAGPSGALGARGTLAAIEYGFWRPT